MRQRRFDAVERMADNIATAAISGAGGNLSAWVGINTLEWRAVMFFKDDGLDLPWFCHVDTEWQRTFLLIVAAELFCTT